MSGEEFMYTCLKCHVRFGEEDIHRAHYKTDWHKYNLKRHVAGLPPVTAENFADRIKAFKREEERTEDPANLTCQVCNKHFNTRNATENHLQSKKHKELVAKQQQKLAREEEKLRQKQAEKGVIDTEQAEIAAKNLQNMSIQSSSTSQGKASSSSHTTVVLKEEEEDEDDAMSVESWDGESLGLEECLFCSHVSKNMEKSIKHMMLTHSFFIPELEFVSDLEGLITYLGAKVGEGNICLWCNEKGKSYRSTKAVQQHMLDKGHCKMLFEGDALFEYSDYYDYRKSYPDYVEGEEKDEDEEEEWEDEEHVEEYDGRDVVERVLPSGAVISHRSLQRYFRQNVPKDRPSQLTPVNKFLAQYKALGWTGTSGAVSRSRAKDMMYMRRQKQRHQMRLSCKAHKLVNHFRPQVVF